MQPYVLLKPITQTELWYLVNSGIYSLARLVKNDRWSSYSYLAVMGSLHGSYAMLVTAI